MYGQMYLHEGTTTMTGQELELRREDVDIDVEDFRGEMMAPSLKTLRCWMRERCFCSNENTARLIKIYDSCLRTGGSWHGARWMTRYSFDADMNALMAKRLRRGMDFAFTLPLGEGFEKAFCTAAVRAGKTAFRPDNSHIAQIQEDNAYQRYQRDIVMMLVDGTEINVEIKALSSPFSYPSTFVGSVGKWDNKMFPVFAVIIIDSVSLEMRWAYADVEAQKEWRRVNMGQGLSYSVPKHLLMSIDDLLPYLL